MFFFCVLLGLSVISRNVQNNSLHLVTKELLVCIKTQLLFWKTHHFLPFFTSANILLTDTYVPKISDFGLARASVTFTRTIMTDRVVGTAAYMAPEALRGEITPKSDIFSFGVVSRTRGDVCDCICVVIDLILVEVYKIKSI